MRNFNPILHPLLPGSQLLAHLGAIPPADTVQRYADRLSAVNQCLDALDNGTLPDNSDFRQYCLNFQTSCMKTMLGVEPDEMSTIMRFNVWDGDQTDSYLDAYRSSLMVRIAESCMWMLLILVTGFVTYHMLLGVEVREQRALWPAEPFSYVQDGAFTMLRQLELEDMLKALPDWQTETRPAPTPQDFDAIPSEPEVPLPKRQHALQTLRVDA